MPVEKVDKPEPPPTYYVDATVETKDDRGRRQGEQQSDEYSGSHAAPGWQKIYASQANRRYLKLRREDIVRAWFRGTLMQRGISLAEIDIEIRDGRILRGTHVILATREDFWILKKFQPGQAIPLNMIIKDPFIEVSVPAPKPATQPLSGQAHGTISRKKAIDIKNILIYATIGAVIFALIIFIITK